MKSLKKVFLLGIFVVFGLMMASCIETKTYKVTFDTMGGSTIKEVEVEEGQKVEKPEDPTRSGYEFKGWYLEKTYATEYTFEEEVKESITLYARWEVDASQNKILINDVQLPSNIVLYQANKKEKDNKRIEFMDLTKAYLVGDDNPWRAEPKVSFVKYELATGKTTPTTVESWEYEITISILENGTYVVLDEANLNRYVEKIDNVACTVDFSDEAIGQSFQISVLPKGLTEKQLENKEKYTVNYEFDVVDGYNVYTPKELAYLENRKSGNEADAWNAFKTENGLQLDFYPHAFIFQNDIVLTAKDVPSYFFYQEHELSKSDSDYERALGSMKDWMDFYIRELVDDEELHIYGNYFTLDTQSFKEVVRGDNKIVAEGEVISHATLIKLRGAETATSSIEGVNIIGNAPRVENVIKSGGQIFMKVEAGTFTAYNNITSCSFIAYFPNRTSQPYLIEKCRAYDSFNCFVYNWGSDKVTIKDSEMIGAGGPVIIQDHVNPKAADGGHPAKTFIENSTLESYVTGSEGWFTVVKASAFVPQIKGLNALFTPFGRSFLKSNLDNTLTYMNLICVNKSGDAEGLTNDIIKGSLQFDSYQAFEFGENNPYIAGLLAQAGGQGAPVFQTSAATATAGYAYGTTNGLFDITNSQIVDPTNAIYQGEYLCMYYQGMAFTFGYFNNGDKYNPQ